MHYFDLLIDCIDIKIINMYKLNINISNGILRLYLNLEIERKQIVVSYP